MFNWARAHEAFEFFTLHLISFADYSSTHFISFADYSSAHFISFA